MGNVPKLLEAMRANHVLKTVLVGIHATSAPQMNIGDSREDQFNAEILRIASFHPEYFIPFIAVRSGSGNPELVQRLLERGPRGVEIRRGDSITRESGIDDQSLAPLYKFCERRGIPIIFHVNLERYQHELERVLRSFSGLKAMCPLLSGSDLALQRADYLMKSYPNLYTDTSFGETDLLEANLVGYSLNSDRLRALLLTYHDRILFGTCDAAPAQRTTASETRKIRVHRDLLEKDAYSRPDAPEEVLTGVGLGVSMLLKIYCTNAECFLNVREPKKSFGRRGPPGPRRRDMRERVNWSRVNEFMTESLGLSKPVNEDFLFSLNRLVLQDFAEQRRTRGHYRKTSVVIRRMGNVMHVPPNAKDIPVLMRQLLSSIDPPLGPSAVGHVARVFLRLQEIHPFHEGNGRTGRALATYLLLRSGFSEKNGRSLEQYFDSNIEDYYDALYESGKGDPLPWLLFFAAAVESVMMSDKDNTNSNGVLSAIARRLRRSFRHS